MTRKLAAIIAAGTLVAGFAPSSGLASEPLPGPYEHSEGSSCPALGWTTPLLMCEHTATAGTDGSFTVSLDIDSGNNGSIPQPLDGRHGSALASLETRHSLATPVSRIAYRVRLDLLRASYAYRATIGSALATTLVQGWAIHESCESFVPATLGSCWTTTSLQNVDPGVMTFDLTLDPRSAGRELEPGRVRIIVQVLVQASLRSEKQSVVAPSPTPVCFGRFCIYGARTEAPLATQGYARGVLEGSVASIEAVV